MGPFILQNPTNQHAVVVLVQIKVASKIPISQDTAGNALEAGYE